MKISTFFRNIKTWLGDAKFYFWISVIFFVFTLLCFTWQIWDTFSFSAPIDTTIWGQFGDFIGGTLGTIFSLISVISNFACTIFGKVKCTFFGNVKCTL